MAQQFPYFFIIYSCQHNIEKANLLYDLINPHIRKFGARPLIAVGGSSHSHTITNGKYLTLPCGDFYENLTEKSLSLFRAVLQINPNLKGIFKCDDDILPSFEHISNLFKEAETADYLGKLITIPQTYYTKFHYGKCRDVAHHTPQWVPACTYAAGPLYYLSAVALRHLTTVNPIFCFFEDVMVGINLARASTKITQRINPPISIETYCDSTKIFAYKPLTQNIQNINNQMKFVIIPLHGGLGNQLFMAAVAHKLATQRGLYPILVQEMSPLRYTHNRKITEFIDTIFSKFAVKIAADIRDIPALFPTISPTQTTFYKEQTNKWSIFDESLFKEEPIKSQNGGFYITTKNYILNGYFQNEKYIHENFANLLVLSPQKVEIQQKYSDLNERYFWHIRRGDYTTDQFKTLYGIDYQHYFESALLYICERDQNAKFYILSDDPEWILNQSFLVCGECVRMSDAVACDVSTDDKFTVVHEPDTLNALALMLLCQKGGICSNSTFSWWGAYLSFDGAPKAHDKTTRLCAGSPASQTLNSNANKIVIFPKKWMNVDYPIDIAFKGSILL